MLLSIFLLSTANAIAQPLRAVNCEVSIDAFPGEEFGIGCADFTYISGNDTCTNQTFTGGDPEVFPLPSSTNTSLTVSLDDINCDPEEYVDLPILISSALSGTISSLDFAVIVTTDAPDAFYAEPEVVDVLAGTSPNIVVMAVPGSPGQYVVRFRYVAQSATPFAGTNNQIGVLRIYRPPNLCQGYTIGADLVAGRIRSVASGPISGIVCRAVQLGGNVSEECEVDGMPFCSDDFHLTITKEEDLDDCSTLKVYATLSWDTLGYGDTLQFKQIRAILNFNMGNGVSITNAQLEGLSCPDPGDNDPSLCHAGCLDYGGNTVELCINVGSPIVVANNARIVVTFDAPSGCIQGATVRKMTLQRPDSMVCQPNIDSIAVFPYCSPMMENFIRGNIATELGCWIEGINIAIVAMDDHDCDENIPINSDTSACAPFTSGCLCDINTAGEYVVTPSKNDNPLNGVTTYDLVLISKHILGSEPLSNPYKIIAADANKSGGITTFDIVEFRKLILGTYDSLPNNTSWRFLPKDLEFVNPANPFQVAFKEAITAEIDGNGIEYSFTYNADTLNPDAADFVGIKVGDVNCTAVNCSPTCADCATYPQRPANPTERFTFGVPGMHSEPGETIVLPVYAGSAQPLVAYQAGLRFDPDRFEFLAVSAGDVPGFTPDCINLSEAAAGKVKVLWLSFDHESNYLQPDQVLFYLALRAKKAVRGNELILTTDDAVFANLGYTSEKLELPLQAALLPTNGQRAQPSGSGPLAISCSPNPTSGAIALSMVSEVPGLMQVAIFGPYGVRVYYREIEIGKGANNLSVPEAVVWPAGIYTWQVQVGAEKVTGRFVKL